MTYKAYKELVASCFKNRAHFESVDTLPEQSRVAALELFIQNETDSERARTIRHQLKHLWETGQFDLE